MSRRILLVEDETNIAEPLADYLEREGFVVAVAPTLAAAVGLLDGEIDLVVLDWMLPDGQGTELLKRWRREGREQPVIFLTARHELIDKVLGLELGANDYVTKPFEPRELLARIQVQLRTSRGKGSSTANEPETSSSLEMAGICLSPDAMTVRYRGDAVELTKMEFLLLKLLMENPGRVFTRDELLNRVWGFDHYPTTRTVDTHILGLRHKLAPELFETVRGVGYRFAREKN